MVLLNDTMLSQADLIVDVNPYSDYATFKTNADFHIDNFVDLFDSADDDDDADPSCYTVCGCMVVLA